MTFATVEFNIKPTDGWVKVADDPAYLFIKPTTDSWWFLTATASGAPGTTYTAAALALTFTNQPTTGQTITLDGRVYTVLTAFDPEEPEADAFLLGGSAEGTIDNLVAVVNGRAAIPAVAATGTVTLTGLPVADQEVVIGEDAYVFKAAADGPFEVTIGTDEEDTAENLTVVINTDGTSGVSASDGTTGVVDLVADEAGFDGNAIVLTTNAANTAVSGTGTLGDGANEVPAVPAHATVSAAKTSSAIATFTAISAGANGNSIPVSENLSNATFAGDAKALTGGVSPARGLSMQGPPEDRRQAYEKVGSTTAEFYIRVANPTGEATHFAVIRDQS